MFSIHKILFLFKAKCTDISWLLIKKGLYFGFYKKRRKRGRKKEEKEKEKENKTKKKKKKKKENLLLVY